MFTILTAALWPAYFVAGHKHNDRGVHVHNTVPCYATGQSVFGGGGGSRSGGEGGSGGALGGVGGTLGGGGSLGGLGRVSHAAHNCIMAASAADLPQVISHPGPSSSRYGLHGTYARHVAAKQAWWLPAGWASDVMVLPRKDPCFSHATSGCKKAEPWG